MTKKQAMKKCRTLIQNVHKDLIKKCEELIDGGGVGLCNYEDNFIAPRIIVSAAIKNEGDYFMVRDCDKKAVNNLKYF
jgi:hypothetical protein